MTVIDEAPGRGGNANYILDPGVFRERYRDIWFSESTLINAQIDGIPISNNSDDTFPASVLSVFTCEIAAGETGISLGRDVKPAVDFSYCRLVIRDSSGTIKHDWDASATNGTGLVLEDVVGGADGTLIGFPTDDSQWVFYEAPDPVPVLSLPLVTEVSATEGTPNVTVTFA